MKLVHPAPNSWQVVQEQQPTDGYSVSPAVTVVLLSMTDADMRAFGNSMVDLNDDLIKLHEETPPVIDNGPKAVPAPVPVSEESPTQSTATPGTEIGTPVGEVQPAQAIPVGNAASTVASTPTPVPTDSEK